MKALFTSIGYNFRRLGDFSGRETQILFWPYAGLVYGLASVIGMAIFMVPIANMFVEMMTQIQQAAQQGGNTEPAFVKSPEMLMPDFSGLTLPIVLLNLVTLLLLAAAVARRLHDRNRSALWGFLPVPCMAIGLAMMPTSLKYFVMTAPDPKVLLTSINNLIYFGLFVLLVVLLIGEGTKGSNRFGPEIAVPD